jgi:Ca2+-binding EF-hand superfamily protein
MVSSIGGSGQFDASAISQMRQNFFNKIDQNSDGSINKTEFADSLEGMEGVNADDIFSKLDTNSDNSISKDELNAAMDKMDEQMKKNPPPPPPMGGSGTDNKTSASSDETKSNKIFDSLDTNKDGYVSITELMAAHDEKTANKIMAEVDTDKDGKISKNENDAFLKKMQENMQSKVSGTDFSTENSTTFQQDLLIKLIESINANSGSSVTSNSKTSLSSYA